MESTNSLGIPKRHEPAKITDIHVKLRDSVEKQTPLLVYEYRTKFDPQLPEFEDAVLLKALSKNVDAQGFISRREYLRSPFEGEVTKISCNVGDTVKHNNVLMEVTVACSHGAVFNGLCGLCGKDVSGIDTSGVPDSRANIDMLHDNTGIKVSYEFAADIDSDIRKSLWKRKKLSLIIDLDQTIIHAYATINPHFETWLIDHYEGPQLTTVTTDAAATDPPQLPEDIDTFVLPGSPLRYFIKLRPGLRDFLSSAAKLYDMHVYTMGNRPYADAVSKVIDPESKLFNGRVLSRDENGSDTKKSLKRLFPVDTSMVVILDDRADIWEWSPNLIKVHPYEFFSGVGDINAGKLAPQQPTMFSEQNETDAVASEEEEEDKTGNHLQSLHEAIIRAQSSSRLNDDDDDDDGDDDDDDDGQAEEQKGKDKVKLVDNDQELAAIQDILAKLHERYYRQLDYLPADAKDEDAPDLAQLLTHKKHQVLRGVTIGFTATFPINKGAPPPHKSELWLWAESFGARCEMELSPRTTHVVAGKPGTEKVHMARRRSKEADTTVPLVVKTNWLLDCIGQWKRLDETPYLWYEDDKSLVQEMDEHIRSMLSGNSNLKHKQTEGVAFSAEKRRGTKQSRRQTGGSAVDRLRRQEEQDTNGLSTADTTDIEEELERQEAGLEEHEEEVNDFVKSIDWDDLEREMLEDDSEFDFESDEGEDNSASHSRTSSTSNLRQTALRHATARLRRLSSSDGSKQRRKVLEATTTANDLPTDSSDAYDEDADDGDESDKDSEISKSRSKEPGHRTKRRRTAQVNDKRERQTQALLSKMRNKEQQSPSSEADEDGNDMADDRNQTDETLFAGIKDSPIPFSDDSGVEGNDDEEDGFEEAGSSSKYLGYDDDDEGESIQWGEDDDEDEENFDDLINDLEEEISNS